ncbi:unnamed protein product [Toxocara canis]|uniref:MADF domain-containing protein n=1 Tax=Toxocara canis TaxID=6265 RepID=A0A183TY30_TOXCA|nr:unnamed protein product [Toxocara canis]
MDVAEEGLEARWSTEARVMLINEVRARPALWAISQQSKRRDPTVAELRRQIAKLISAKFGFSVTSEDVVQQWKYLNRHHKNYLRNRGRFENDGPIKQHKHPIFRYARHMRFLEDRQCFSNDDEQSVASGGGQLVQQEAETFAWSASSNGVANEWEKDSPILIETTDMRQECLSVAKDNVETKIVSSDVSGRWTAEDLMEQMDTKMDDDEPSSSVDDENDEIGRMVASALRRAEMHDTTIAQQLRNGITKLLAEVEEKLMSINCDDDDNDDDDDDDDDDEVEVQFEAEPACLSHCVTVSHTPQIPRSPADEYIADVRIPRHSLTRSLLEMDFPRKDPTLESFFEILNDKVALDEFMVVMKLMPHSALIGDRRVHHGTCVLSENCEGQMYTAMRKGRPAYRCNRCGKIRSMGHGDIHDRQGRSFFYRMDGCGRPHTAIKREAVLWIVYCTGRDMPSADITRLADSKFRVSKATIIDWQKNLRELMRKELQSRPPLGGPEREVEIDEWLISCKTEEGYGNRDRGPWILGMVDTITKECRFVTVARRDAETVVPIIQKHIAEGTTIISGDKRRSCMGIGAISSMFYRQLASDESSSFVDPENNSSTTWRTLQTRINRTSPALVPGYLALQWWLSVNGKEVTTDPFLRLCDLIAKYYPQ